MVASARLIPWVVEVVRERGADEAAHPQASIKEKQDKAAKLERAVEAEELKLKKQVVAAKKQREDGDGLEEKARGKVHDVDRMRDEANKLEAKAEAARRRFLAAEKPVELATKLATHDHSVYRAAELAVAKEVVSLSEHPNDSQLHGKVDGLVAKSKAAKKRMEGDSKLLKTLQQRAGDSNFDGDDSYDRLRQKSVDVAKDAKRIARHAEAEAEKGHREREDAAKEVRKVENAMKKPEEMHTEADKLRKEYTAEEKELNQLRGMLDASQTLASAKKTSYSQDRVELKKLVDGGSTKSEAIEAKTQYDKLEDADEAKEREKAKKASGESEGMKHAHIIKSSQSTFLTGLLNPHSPWDKNSKDAQI